MIEQDTVKLLRECDAGIEMGISAINDVLENVADRKLKDILTRSRAEHEKLEGELRVLLKEAGDTGKDPNPMAKGMSWMKTNMKMAMNNSDQTIASLITDGCDMGVKSLSRYLNEYQAAGPKARDLAQRLISLEEKLGEEVRAYL